jgi:hypothetical protein
MAKSQAPAGKIKDRALEVGLYLPLGVYATVRDELAETDRKSLTKTYSRFVKRGQERLSPIESAIKRRARQAEKTASDTARQARTTAGKATRKARVAAVNAAPRLPRVAAPRRASELPIKGYASLTVAEITAQLSELTQTDLARVYKFERAHENRSTVLEAVEAKLVDLPITTYDALTVDEINGRLTDLTQKELKVVRSYEERTKARSTILERIDSELSA